MPNIKKTSSPEIVKSAQYDDSIILFKSVSISFFYNFYKITESTYNEYKLEKKLGIRIERELITISKRTSKPDNLYVRFCSYKGTNLLSRTNNYFTYKHSILETNVYNLKTKNILFHVYSKNGKVSSSNFVTNNYLRIHFNSNLVLNAFSSLETNDFYTILKKELKLEDLNVLGIKDNFPSYDNFVNNYLFISRGINFNTLIDYNESNLNEFSAPSLLPYINGSPDVRSVIKSIFNIDCEMEIDILLYDRFFRNVFTRANLKWLPKLFLTNNIKPSDLILSKLKTLENLFNNIYQINLVNKCNFTFSEIININFRNFKVIADHILFLDRLNLKINVDIDSFSLYVNDYAILIQEIRNYLKRSSLFVYNDMAIINKLKNDNFKLTPYNDYSNLIQYSDGVIHYKPLDIVHKKRGYIGILLLSENTNHQLVMFYPDKLHFKLYLELSEFVKNKYDNTKIRNFTNFNIKYDQNGLDDYLKSKLPDHYTNLITRKN